MIIKSGTAVPEAEPQAATRSTSRATQSAEPEPEDLEKITVTGTRIRGGSTPSPVIIIGSERIREEGFTDLGEAIDRQSVVEGKSVSVRDDLGGSSMIKQ